MAYSSCYMWRRLSMRMSLELGRCILYIHYTQFMEDIEERSGRVLDLGLKGR